MGNDRKNDQALAAQERHETRHETRYETLVISVGLFLKRIVQVCWKTRIVTIFAPESLAILMQYHHAHESSYAADMTSPKTIQKLLEISHKKAMTIQVFQLSMFH